MATYITPPFITEFKLVPCRPIYTNHLITYKQLSLRQNLQIEPSNHLLFLYNQTAISPETVRLDILKHQMLRLLRKLPMQQHLIMETY